jgi:pimeloyl-ACP methyl ester carboxylesterase
MPPRSMVLKDGRTLGYAEYGDPVGKPIFLFHGTPGSRLFHPFDEITSKAKARLICVDRPGYGLSTFQPSRTILDWPEDVLQLAVHLHFQRFSVVAHSGGGPYALACSYVLPQFVTSTLLISSAGPADSPGALRNMVGLNRSGYRFGRWMPWPVWSFLIWMIYRDVRQLPEKIMEREALTRPKADAELWKQDSVREVCYASVIEAFHHGTRGVAWDARLITRAWGYALEEIHSPVHLWHGTNDRRTPIQMAQSMSDRIPMSKLHLCEGQAHLLIFQYWQEILSQATLEHP